MATIKIEYVRLPNGAISVFPDEETIEAVAREAEVSLAQAAKLNMKAEVTAEANVPDDVPIAALIRQQWREARDEIVETGRILEVFETPTFRIYTRKDRLDAKRAATSFNEKTETFDLDEELLVDRLVCAATGMDLDSVRNLDEPIYQALVSRVNARVGVNPLKLSFFNSKLTSSPSETP
jgi:hypothetical protein